MQKIAYLLDLILTVNTHSYSRVLVRAVRAITIAKNGEMVIQQKVFVFDSNFVEKRK